MSGITIAVDGPGSAGKGTVARGVARALGYQYIDTGSMYRALALFALHKGVSWSDGPALAALAAALRFHFRWDGDHLRVEVDEIDVTREIRDDAIGRGASDVSIHPEVRTTLVALQRALAREGGVVMDGRDIGTVVLPDAALKVFLDAGIDERAQRRHEELLRRGEQLSFAHVRAGLEARDRQDTEREHSPLVAASDAIHLDTSDLTIRQAIDAVLALARERERTRSAP
ncbi:MAG: (d)CMP kinase [Deltaproteobacteria bacterium]|nr:(d)CMP kinase [Deltaproteobacteria bacterium]